jgi:glycosyltransferase involved in cell wall biosynthesis
MPTLEDLGVTLGLEMPDYGRGIGYLRAILTSAPVASLARSATFIYTDGTALESYLAAYAARRAGRGLTLELLANTDFDIRYMYSRFGICGAVYALVGAALYRYVRKQAVAGIYVSDDLMRRFPVAGSHRAAVSPVYLDPSLWAKPRPHSGPATQYLYVGHLEKVKRVDLILKALGKAKAQLPAGWRLTLVGDGPEWGALEALAAKLGIGGNVVFIGRVPRDEGLFRVYQNAHLLLITSYTEGFCRVLAEGIRPAYGAQHSGAPPVVGWGDGSKPAAGRADRAGGTRARAALRECAAQLRGREGIRARDRRKAAREIFCRGDSDCVL